MATVTGFRRLIPPQRLGSEAPTGCGCVAVARLSSAGAGGPFGVDEAQECKAAAIALSRKLSSLEIVATCWVKARAKEIVSSADSPSESAIFSRTCRERLAPLA